MLSLASLRLTEREGVQARAIQVLHGHCNFENGTAVLHCDSPLNQRQPKMLSPASRYIAQNYRSITRVGDIQARDLSPQNQKAPYVQIDTNLGISHYHTRSVRPTNIRVKVVLNLGNPSLVLEMGIDQTLQVVASILRSLSVETVYRRLEGLVISERPSRSQIQMGRCPLLRSSSAGLQFSM